MLVFVLDERLDAVFDNVVQFDFGCDHFRWLDGTYFG